jgi:hypothetical protein
MKRSIIGPAVLALIVLGCGNAAGGNPSGAEDGPSAGGPYTVSFVTYASAAIPAQTVNHGEKAGKVPDPAGGPANNAGFAGWYKNGGIDKWDFNADAVTENITFCAGWKFTAIEDLTAFLGSVQAAPAPAARHMAQGTDPNPGELPIPVTADIPLTRANWAALVNGIEAQNKKVSLDLSPCAAGEGAYNSKKVTSQQEGGLWADGSFNPGDTAYITDRVNDTIAGLVLPDAAAKLYQAARHLNLLREIRGNNVTEITTGGEEGSFHGGLMERVNFPRIADIGSALEGAEYLEAARLPEVTQIGTYAFWKTRVSDVYIPRAARIGNKAFAESGPGNLAITLGSAPPSLGTKIFDGVTVTKRVTIRVPAAAKAAYTEAWIDGLKGKGWTSSGAGTGSLMRNIVVTIEAQ